MSSMPLMAGNEPSLSVRYDETVPVLDIPPSPTFDALRGWLREQLPLRVDQVGGRSVRLDLGTRDVQLFDLRRIIHLLRDEFSIDVTGIYVEPAAIQRYAERELKLKLFARPSFVPAPDLQPQDLQPQDVQPELQPQDVNADPDASVKGRSSAAPVTATPSAAPELQPEDLQPEDAIVAEPVVTPAVPAAKPLPTDLQPEDLVQETTRPAIAFPTLGEPKDPGRRTLSVHRTLRSGGTVQFDGDVVLYGDVNPGAQIIASGNIVVLGALKGMVHAGAAGEEGAFILALDFRPTQLRIARRIAIAPEARSEAWNPEMASVVDGAILIEPYRGRLR